MAELLSRVRSAVRSLGNEGAVANVRSDMAAAADMRAEVERLEQRVAASTGPTPVTPEVPAVPARRVA